MAERPTQECPLCHATVAGEGLEALGRHFRRCPKTEGRRREPGAGGQE